MKILNTQIYSHYIDKYLFRFRGGNMRTLNTRIDLYCVENCLFGFTIINKSLNRKHRKIKLTKVLKKYIKYKNENTNRGQSIDMLIVPTKKKVKYL